MMEKIQELLTLSLAEFIKNNPDQPLLENGDEFITIFNDGACIVGMECEQLTIKIILGTPYKVDFSLDVTEEV